MKSKYTFVFNADLEALLDSLVNRLNERVSQSDIAKSVEYIVFGGGYGRGEGGVFESSKGTMLYNDIDFFVLAHDNVSDADLIKIDSFLATLSQELHAMVEIDVDFSKAVRTSYAVGRMDIMSWREMALCKNVVYGDVDSFKKKFVLSSDKTEVVPSELAKLAMNRFSGLVYAFEKLSQNVEILESDADFIARNINKALFASGDIYLAEKGNLPFKISSRLAEIKAGEFSEGLKLAYEKATEFKALPKIHFSKDMYRADLISAFELLKKAYFENLKYLQKRNLVRRLKDFILRMKLFKEFAKFKKFGFFADPKLELSCVAIEIIENGRIADKSVVLAYRNIWEKLS